MWRWSTSWRCPRHFADDLKRLSQAQTSDHTWCAETKWQDNRLVVAHDPEVAARRGQARDKTIAELVAMGQQCSDKLDGQDIRRVAIACAETFERRDGKLLLVLVATLQKSGPKAQILYRVMRMRLSRIANQNELFAALELALPTPENLDLRAGT
jgi:hypothetical protein